MGAIADRCRERGINFEILAKEMGDLSAVSLSRIDRGLQNPSAQVLRRLFETTGLTPNEILGIDASQQPQAEA